LKLYTIYALPNLPSKCALNNFLACYTTREGYKERERERERGTKTKGERQRKREGTRKERE